MLRKTKKKGVELATGAGLTFNGAGLFGANVVHVHLFQLPQEVGVRHHPLG